MIYLMGPQVTYKCRVEQLVRPSFNRYNNIKSVHTVVSFQYGEMSVTQLTNLIILENIL